MDRRTTRGQKGGAPIGRDVLAMVRELDEEDETPRVKREAARDDPPPVKKPRQELAQVVDHYSAREQATRQLADEVLEIESAASDEDEDPERVCWANLCSQEGRCRTICGFAPDEFEELYDLVAAHVPENTGRGMRSKISKQDKLLMTLCYLKHYETNDRLKDTFGVCRSHVQSILITTISAIAPVLYAHFVTNLATTVDAEQEEVALFPDAKFVLDATFQSCWTPPGSCNERRLYYSEQRKLYGLKSLCLHDRSGLVLWCVPGEKGATADEAICRDNVAVLRAILQDGTVLAGPGHPRMQPRVANAVVPRAKTNEPRDAQFNEELAEARAICTQFYARMKSLFLCMSAKYRNSRDEYVTFFQLCVALTNYDVILRPLEQ